RQENRHVSRGSIEQIVCWLVHSSNTEAQRFSEGVERIGIVGHLADSDSGMTSRGCTEAASHESWGQVKPRISWSCQKAILFNGCGEGMKLAVKEAVNQRAESSHFLLKSRGGDEACRKQASPEVLVF